MIYSTRYSKLCSSLFTFFAFTIATKSKESFHRIIASTNYSKTKGKAYKLDQFIKKANHLDKLTKEDTYSPDERYKAHSPAETLNTSFKPAIVLIVFYIAIKHKPEDVLH